MSDKANLLDKLHAAYLELFLEANDGAYGEAERAQLAGAARHLRRCHKRLCIARFNAATPSYAEANETLTRVNRRLSEEIDRIEDTAVFLADIGRLIESVEELIAAAAHAIA